MRISRLAKTDSDSSARNAGTPPRIWAELLLVPVIVASLLMLMVGCDAPGLTDEELESDPMPEFEDSAISGNWLLEGKLVSFEIKVHGVYLFRESNDEDVMFKLKRAGDLLMME